MYLKVVICVPIIWDSYWNDLNYMHYDVHTVSQSLFCIHRGNNFRKFINFLAQVKQGEVNGLKVRLDRLQVLIPTSYVEHLDIGKDDEMDKSLQHRLHT